MKWKNSLLILCFLLLLVLIGYQVNSRLRLSQVKALRKADGSIDNRLSVEEYDYTGHQSSSLRYLKNLDYSFLEQVNIPGMPGTRESDWLDGRAFSQSQCPQGLCFADQYILITSYAEGTKDSGSLFVFNRSTGAYLCTLAMDSRSHLGGICYDGKNIWICNSSKNILERLSYDFLTLMAEQNRGRVVDASHVVSSYAVNNAPSCVTFYGGRLWVATHTIIMDSVAVAYYYDTENDLLSPLNTYTIPQKVQGIAFDSLGRVFLSVSYGRSSSSFLKIYDSLVDMSADPDCPALSIEMPPCSEELCIEDRSVYLIFESAGQKYYDGTDGNGISPAPIDQILIIRGL